MRLNPRLSQPIFGHSAGSATLDRPHCKQFRQKSIWHSLSLGAWMPLLLGNLPQAFPQVAGVYKILSRAHLRISLKLLGGKFCGKIGENFAG